MRLKDLERKAATVGILMGLPLKLGMMGRKYRVEDQRIGEIAVFTPAYLPAKDVWNRLDWVETALRNCKVSGGIQS